MPVLHKRVQSWNPVDSNCSLPCTKHWLKHSILFDCSHEVWCQQISPKHRSGFVLFVSLFLLLFSSYVPRGMPLKMKCSAKRCTKVLCLKLCSFYTSEHLVVPCASCDVAGQSSRTRVCDTCLAQSKRWPQHDWKTSYQSDSAEPSGSQWWSWTPHRSAKNYQEYNGSKRHLEGSESTFCQRHWLKLQFMDTGI